MASALPELPTTPPKSLLDQDVDPVENLPPYGPELPPRPGTLDDFENPIKQMYDKMYSTNLPLSYRMCFSEPTAIRPFYEVHRPLLDLSGEIKASRRERHVEYLARWVKECFAVILQSPQSESTFSSILVSEVVQYIKTKDNGPELDSTRDLTQLASMIFRMFEEASFSDRTIVLVTLHQYFRSGGNEHDQRRWIDSVMGEGKKRDMGTCKQFAFNVYRRLLRYGWIYRIIKSHTQWNFLSREDIEGEILYALQRGVPYWKGGL